MLLLFSTIGCQSEADAEKEESERMISEEPEAQNQLPESFYAHYNRFLTDSTYQMEHIPFPINGFQKVPEEGFKWTEENWVLHKPVNLTEYERMFAETMPGIYTEKILHRSLPVVVTRRWSYEDGEWYLIYYSLYTGD